jgi:anti-anti-sigma factor
MEIQYSELDNNVRMIKLTGDLDINGVNEIDIKFTGYCAGDQPRILVDLSAVSFLASIGIRMLILTAKSVVNRGGRMALLSPTSEVKDILEVTGIPAIIPVYENFESAQTVVLS